jgi:hypothetical protein
LLHPNHKGKGVRLNLANILGKPDLEQVWLQRDLQNTFSLQKPNFR